MILRICVVIPAFECHRTVSSVLKDVVTRTRFPVLLIDDGSETPLEHVLYSFEVRQALEERRVRVLRWNKRRGTGRAMRLALDLLSADGFTHLAVMRGDGSHDARPIAALVEAASERPWDLIAAGRAGAWSVTPRMRE